MFIRALLAIAFLTFHIPTSQIENEQPVVRAVLFYSPTCGHCKKVITQYLSPLIDQFGEQLQIIGVDVTQPQGQVYFEAAHSTFNLESIGVPFLVVGNEYLIGSVDIPEQFPNLIEKYLAQGGVDWPDIPGLRDAIHASQTATQPTPTSISPTASASIPTPTLAPARSLPDTPSDSTFSLPNETKITAWQRVTQDPTGNGIAIAILLGMFIVLGNGINIYKTTSNQVTPRLRIVIPILCIIGLGVASYLTYVETTQTTAVCGPIGDCNMVQQSEYASLFGILPIGLLGMIGYAAILFSWGMTRIQDQSVADLARFIMFALSTIGILFSIYLTFLEPFVIGATCIWCVTSAIIMTALFLLTIKDGKVSYQKLRVR